VFPNVEVRHLHAVVVLAEEMNFTRAAHRLNVTQPALSKQITELEEQYGLHLFNREKGRLIELTESGQIFVEEASAVLSHAERAIQLARATQDGSDRVLTVGHSPHGDQSWISTVVTIRLPLYPRLRVRLMGQFPVELVRSVIVGELNFALVTAPLLNADITAVPFAQAPLYAVLPESHPAININEETLGLQDLVNDEWILFPKRLYRLSMMPSSRWRAATGFDQNARTTQSPRNRRSTWFLSR
jgi:DNA-binding transcriptional LysR family regulator